MLTSPVVVLPGRGREGQGALHEGTGCLPPDRGLQSLHQETTREETQRSAGGCFMTKVVPYQHRKSYCGDMMVVVKPCYLHNGISYTGKMSSLHYKRPLKKCKGREGAWAVFYQIPVHPYRMG